MTTIRATQAQQLADLMQRESAIAATTETVNDPRPEETT